MSLQLKIRKGALYVSIFLLILSGYVYLFLGQKVERMLFGISAVVLLSGISRVEGIKWDRRDVNSIFHTMFVISLIVCGIVFLKPKPVVYAAAMYLVYFISNDILIRNCQLSFFRYVFKINHYISIGVVLLSFLLKPVTMINYSGIFGNPNGMGIFAATYSTMLLAEMLSAIENRKKVKISYILFYMISLFLVVVSSCRTALAVIVLEIIVFGYFYIKIFPNTRKKWMRIAMAPVTIILLLMLLYSLGFVEVFIVSMVDKFLRLGKNVSNGRTEIWSFVLIHTAGFRDGTSALQQFRFTTMASHNIYFGLMDTFGKIPSILYFIFVTGVIIKGYRLAEKGSGCQYRYALFMTGINFFIVSLMENYLMTNTMILMYMYMPVAKIFYMRQQEKSDADV